MEFALTFGEDGGRVFGGVEVKILFHGVYLWFFFRLLLFLFGFGVVDDCRGRFMG